MRVRHVASTAVLAALFAACTSFEDLPYTGQGTNSSGGNGSSGNNPGDGSVGDGGSTQPEEPPPPPGCEDGETPRDDMLCVSETRGVFVRAGAAAEGDGSKASPFATIGSALQWLTRTPGDGETRETRRELYIASGDYAESIELNGFAFKFFGSFDADFGSIGSEAPSTKIISPVGLVARLENIQQEVRFESVELVASAPPTGALSGIAVFAANVASLVFRAAKVQAPPGISAAEPSPADAPTCSDIDAEGLRGGRCTCDGVSRDGGAGRGLFSNAEPGRPHDGGGGAAAPNSGCSAGGDGASYFDAPAPAPREDAATEGALTAQGWQPNAGVQGTSGAHGAGGGGGGRSGASLGGNGGAGACGGRGGAGGGAGGASFGIVAVDARLTFDAAEVEAQGGGAGAVGGRGGPRTAGGQPTAGAAATNECAGRGGVGGGGGEGGRGGAGAGGPSIAVFVLRSAVEGTPQLKHGTGGQWGNPNRGPARSGALIIANEDGTIP